MRFLTRGVVGVVLAGVVAASVAGCADTTRSVEYNRDDPAERLAGMVAAGTVTRVDEPQQVIVLDNGQMYRVSGDRAIIVNGQPMVLSRVQPGTPVMIRSATPVVYQNGQYVVVTPGPSPVVTAPAGTIVTAPPTVVATPVVTGSTVRIFGRVADLERNGNVKVRVPDGSTFEFRPPAGTVLRKGDPVTIDMTFGAPAPSALPR